MAHATLNPDIRKKVLKSLTYGLHVLTASADGEIAAGTVTWLSQASFQPPLIMVGIKADSRLHGVIERSGQLAVNVVDSEHASMAATFFRPTVVAGGKLNGFGYEPGPQTGSPLLLDLPLWFEARVVDTVKRGDHTVFVAEVVSGGVRDDSAQPLALRATSWSYGG